MHWIDFYPVGSSVLSIKWQYRQSNYQAPQVEGLDPASGEEIRSHELNTNNNDNDSDDDEVCT